MWLQLSNSSLLDEATAAAEAMTMCSALARGKKDKFLVSVSPPAKAAFHIWHSVPILPNKLRSERRMQVKETADCHTQVSS